MRRFDVCCWFVACGIVSGLTLHAADHNSPGLAATAKPDAEGFIPLVTGKDLSGWIGNIKGYVPTADGKLLCGPGHDNGNLYTPKEYANFILRFDFKLTPGANNGLGIRTPTEGDAAYAGMEIQILDDSAEIYKDIKPWQHHGSIYGLVPAKTGHLKPVGQWNYEEVTVDGKHIVVKLNDVVIVDANLNLVKDPKVLEAHPGLARTKGHIGFLSHGPPVEFRNLRIKELP